MLRLSKLTDYAVVVLVRLSDAAGGTVQTTPGIAAATGVPEPTVAKVLKAMVGSGLVASQRGARGGYRLARPLEATPIRDVIEAIDGPIALTSCVEGGAGGCEATALCPVHGRWDVVNEAVREALGAITLAEMQDAAVPRAFRTPGHILGQPLPGQAPPRAPSAHATAAHATAAHTITE